MRRFLFRPLWLLLLAGLSFAGCSGSGKSARESGEPAKTEQGWIIESVIRDGVQMAALAAKAADPLSPQRTVEVKAAPLNQGETRPSYSVAVHLGPEKQTIEAKVVPEKTVWSAATYAEVFGKILKAFQLSPPGESPPLAEDSLVALATPVSTILQAENRRVSRLLSENPLNAEAQDQAALICAVLGLREQGRQWWDPRQACNRATAHLAMALALDPGKISDSGKVAALILGLLMDRKTDCAGRIAELEKAGAQNSRLKPWITAAKLRNSRDWRILQQAANPTMLELLEGFRAKAETVNVQSALTSLGKIDTGSFADWNRLVLQCPFTVNMGHRYALPALENEIKDAASVYGRERIRKMGNLIQFMNAEPGGAVKKTGEGTWGFQVLDDGIWGQFFQRHLFFAMGRTEYFLHDAWGVPDYAKKYDQETRAQFKGLSLFPMYEAWVAEKPGDVDEAGRAAVARLRTEHPEWVRDSLWRRMDQTLGLSQKDGYEGPSAQEWFDPMVPTGTAFAAVNRLWFLGKRKVENPDFFRPYLEIAPSRLDLKAAYVRAKYGEDPSYEVLQQEFGEALDFDLELMKKAVKARSGDPVAYPAGLLKIAEFDPEEFNALGDYYKGAGEKAKAAEAYQRYYDLAPDRVGVANRMDWLVQYYEDTGKTNEATRIAEAGAEVYSSLGLETMGDLMERREKLHLAENYFFKIGERYEDKGPLMGFYLRQAGKHPEYQKPLDGLLKELFLEGMKKVVLADFKEAPARGVRVNATSRETEKVGLLEGALIVAVNGVEVGTFEQYSILRSAGASPAFNLIVYQNGKYQEMEVSPPGRRFGVDMTTFSKQ